MARIGNETRLVLKLAKERMLEQLRLRLGASNSDWADGYRLAFDDWDSALFDIIQELEK